MIRLRAISGLITALAVLVVSVTCTPAACLLPMGPADQPQQKAMKSCCEEPDRPATPTHRVPHDERCPMCQNSALIAKNVDHGASFSSVTIALTFFCPISHVPTLPAALGLVGHGPDCPAPLSPHSLLALHCALLT